MKRKENIISEFDEFSKNYTEDMIKCAPHYMTLLTSFKDHLPLNFIPDAILDLGCGNGNVTEILLKKFPKARYTLIDASPEMLNLCKKRFEKYSMEFIASYFQDFEFKALSYDLVVAGFSLHHCNSDDKKTLFKAIYKSLNPGGIFSCSDLMIHKDHPKHSELIANWKNFVDQNYQDGEKWEWIMEHYAEFDKPDNFDDQLEWLKEAGFENFNLFSNDLYWNHFQAIKA